MKKKFLDKEESLYIETQMVFSRHAWSLQMQTVVLSSYM